MYIFSLVAGGCVATGVDKGGSKKKNKDKLIKAAMMTTTTITGVKGTKLSLYTQL